MITLGLSDGIDKESITAVQYKIQLPVKQYQVIKPNWTNAFLTLSGMRTSKWFQHVQTLSNLAEQLIELKLF